MTDSTKDKRNPYINSAGQRELRKSIIAFIDVLGFKELVRKAKDEDKSQEVFLNFHQALSSWHKREEEYYETKFKMPFIGGKKDRYKIRIFTDCILIGCPISKSGRSYNFIEGCDEFFDILSTIYLLQAEMVNQGYFVRGAIAVDELYMDEVIIYGNGAIEAYEAEASKAKYPRIILTKSASSVLAEICKGFEDQQLENYINKFFFKDSDGQLFISYLESIKIGEDDFQFVSELEKHKNIIELKLAEYKDKPRYLEKYLWTANYHNNFCNQPPYYDDYKIDLTK
ncbi:hypothetical protein [Methylomonas albis]|uniref:Guanylate cyclase domain-containing protein n=1 Tax=Methylomonas albis TaxID=1854563 RepID=A0ABR9D560_9GAMM|nr:hypothetical protein [Methylomonas albis]MBD9358075.1 hypothetical protein [Methylomonas albis]